MSNINFIVPIKYYIENYFSEYIYYKLHFIIESYNYNYIIKYIKI